MYPLIWLPSYPIRQHSRAKHLPYSLLPYIIALHISLQSSCVEKLDLKLEASLVKSVNQALSQTSWSVNSSIELIVVLKDGCRGFS